MKHLESPRPMRGQRTAMVMVMSKHHTSRQSGACSIGALSITVCGVARASGGPLSLLSARSAKLGTRSHPKHHDGVLDFFVLVVSMIGSRSVAKGCPPQRHGQSMNYLLLLLFKVIRQPCIDRLQLEVRYIYCRYATLMTPSEPNNLQFRISHAIALPDHR